MIRPAILLLVSLRLFAGATASEFFTIQVVDAQTGRGVPLVQLKLVNEAAWWTDSQGIVAFNEPGLMGKEVFFHVASHGYEYPKDGFGYRGVKLKPVSGGNATIKLKRLNIAERLYRVTGGGIYRDSVLTGRAVPLKNPVLDGLVFGQDTVIATPYRDKIYWFWGDTSRPAYPLGIFNAAGAISEFPSRGGLDPSKGVNLIYFVDDQGFARGMCQPRTKGPRWIEGLLTVPDETGRERLLARVANTRGMAGVDDWDLMMFNDKKEQFESIQHWNIQEGHDSAHPFRARVAETEYYYLYPNYRVKADLASIKDLSQYDAYTCVGGDGIIRGKDTLIDHDSSDKVIYSWKPGAERLHGGRLRELVKLGKLRPEEVWINLRDFETGSSVEAGRGSVFWNEFRQRWIMIVSARAGEIWFAEADTPTGPWVYARQIVSHHDYNFYNPTQHPFFDQEHGRLIYFEGTYTASFSGAREQTPRYDYNQIMYRLALDDERLSLPSPIYRIRDTNGQEQLMPGPSVAVAKAWDQVQGVAFFAFSTNQVRPDLVPAGFRTNGNGQQIEVGKGIQAGLDTVLFYAAPLANELTNATIEGEWRLVVKIADGFDVTFGMTLRDRASNPVTALVAGEGRVLESSFRNGTLNILLERDGKKYDFSGKRQGQVFTGEWQERGGELKGTWKGNRQNAANGELSSDAVIDLNEFVRKSDGQRYYTTALTPPAGFDTEARPVCRVWKNPMQVLPLDPQVSALPYVRP